MVRFRYVILSTLYMGGGGGDDNDDVMKYPQTEKLQQIGQI